MSTRLPRADIVAFDDGRTFMLDVDFTSDDFTSDDGVNSVAAGRPQRLRRKSAATGEVSLGLDRHRD